MESSTGKWVFEELRGAAVRRHPNEAELFKTEQTGEGEYAGNDALVREILQNAIDARAGEAPLRVRFAIHDHDDAPLQSDWPTISSDYACRCRRDKLSLISMEYRNPPVDSWSARTSAPVAWKVVQAYFKTQRPRMGRAGFLIGSGETLAAVRRRAMT